jgi:Zn-dependent protease
VKGSLQVGRIGGVPLRIHWTFPLLFVLAAAAYARDGGRAVALGLLWIVALFASVTVHEVAHSLVARHRGLKVRDIVLLPIGGVSEIGGLEADANDEIIVAAAGPASSFLLAGALALVGWLTHQTLWPPTLFSGSWVARIMWANVLLAAFNLVPGLPLDGGRILQGVLARRYGEPRATIVAAQVARVVGVLMIAAGFLVNIWLILIGLFVMLAASGEERASIARSRLSGWKVRDVMVPEAPVQLSSSVGEVQARHPGRDERAVPVLDGARYAGIVSVADLAGASSTAPVARFVDVKAPLLDEQADLYPDATVAFDRSQRRSLAVARGAQVTGVIYLRAVDRLQRRLAGDVPSPSRT